MPRDREQRLTHGWIIAETLRAIGHRYNVTPGAVAIAWTLRNPAVTGAIVAAPLSLLVTT